MDRRLGSGNDHRVDADDHFDSLSGAIVRAPCDGFVVAVDGRGREHARFVGAVGLALNLLSTIVFAAMLFRLYRQFGSRGSTDLSHLNLADATAAKRANG